MSDTQALESALDGLVALTAAEPHLADPSRRLLKLRAQLQRQTRYVAVLGQFKRGKSRFLTALPGTGP